MRQDSQGSNQPGIKRTRDTRNRREGGRSQRAGKARRERDTIPSAADTTHWVGHKMCVPPPDPARPRRHAHASHGTHGTPLGATLSARNATLTRWTRRYVSCTPAQFAWVIHPLTRRRLRAAGALRTAGSQITLTTKNFSKTRKGYEWALRGARNSRRRARICAAAAAADCTKKKRGE